MLFLGPAYPYRGGIADTQNYLAKNLVKLGTKFWSLPFFTINILKYFFPGKPQYSKDPKPIGVNIEEKFIVLIQLIGLRYRIKINDYSPNIVFFRYWTPFIALCWSYIAKKLSPRIKGSLC